MGAGESEMNLVKTMILAPIFMLGLVMFAPSLHATTVTVMIGDDDGFGGTQGVTSLAGDLYSNAAAFSLGAIAPGTYSNASALDINTADPWSIYVFNFDFGFDVTSLATITSAIVEIQHGSLGRRASGFSSGSGPGFGFAAVTASAGGSPTGLGDFFGNDTSPTGSDDEESVKISSFDVSSLIAAGTFGILNLTIDGTGISPNPVDLFAMDFARLTVTGVSVVPIPAALPLFGTGLGLLGFLGWRKRRRTVAEAMA